jgi:hypothetical protein
VIKLSTNGDNLIYSSYLGGSGSDQGTDIAVARLGNADIPFVAGQTGSTNFPTANAFDATSNNGDVFVTKISPLGNSLLYSTYLGGDFQTTVGGIDVDSVGALYLTGSTSASDFPLVNPFQSTPGSDNSFLTKFSVAGNSLVYSTYISTLSEGADIAVDNMGHAYVLGVAFSLNDPDTDFPLVNPFDSTSALEDAFVLKMAPSGGSLVYSTLLGGDSDDKPEAIAIDAAGRAYVTGRAESDDFPLVNPFDSTSASPFADPFLSVISPAGNVLEYSTYFGGTGQVAIRGLALDRNGGIYLTGSTTSTNMPILNAFDSTYNGGTDAFVAKFEPTSCICSCHADPVCDAVVDIQDVVQVVNVAFRGAAPLIDVDCAYQRTDVDCSTETTVLDVVKIVNVAFRGANQATEFCEPCI